MQARKEIGSMNHHSLVPAAVGFGLVFFCMDPQTQAYPGFARKYQTSCVTCHDTFPRLNSVGQAFRLNGYRFLDDETYVREEPVSLGAPAYKRVWPEAIWPSDLPLNLPLGLSVPLTVRRTSGVSTEEGADWDFNFPSNVTLLSGGTLGEDMAFWASLEFEMEEGEGEVHFHRVFFEWNDLLSSQFLGFLPEDGLLPENTLNMKIGQIDPGVVPRSIHRQISLSSYLTNTYTVGQSPFALEAPGLTAVELFGFPTRRLGYWAGITTGTSTNDDNPYKDYYGRLAYKFGGIAFDGTLDSTEGEAAESEELPAPSLSEELSLILGLSGYRGKPRVSIGATSFDHDIFRAGGDAQLSLWKAHLNAHYVLGEDENPLGPPNPRNVRSHAYYVEGTYSIYPWLYPYLRYEALHVEDRPQEKTQRLALGAAALLRANLRTSVEYRHFLNGDRGLGDSPDVLLFNLWMAF